MINAGSFVTLVPDNDDDGAHSAGDQADGGDLGPLEALALRSLRAHVARTLMPPRPAELRPARAVTAMALDARTLASLEVLRSAQTGTKEGALLGCLSGTKTAVGARLLAARLAAPSLEPAAINARLDAVEAFLRDPDARARVRRALERVRDGERALHRVELGRWEPADLRTVGQCLDASAALADALPASSTAALSGVRARLSPAQTYAKHGPAPPDIADLVPSANAFEPHTLADLNAELRRALGDADGATAVLPGYSPRLDTARRALDIDGELERLAAKYRAQAGVRSLRVVRGTRGQLAVYVPARALERAAMPSGFRLSQVLVAGSKFATAELAELEAAARLGESEAGHLEGRVLDWLRDHVVRAAAPVRAVVQALAEVDVAAASAKLALEQSLCRCAP